MSQSKSDIEILTQDWVQKFHFENKVDLNLQTPAENESTKIEVGDLPIDLLPKLEFSTSPSSPPSTKNSDSYLQSILSSPSPAANTSSNSCTDSETCACYKCQRQKRRVGIGRNAMNSVNTVASAAVSATSRNITEQNHLQDKFKTPPLSSLNSYTSSTTTTSTTSSAVTTNRSGSFTKMPSTTTTVGLAATSSPPTPIPSPPPPQQQQNKSNAKRSNTVRKTPTLKSYEKHMPKPAYSQQDSIYRIEQEAAAEELRQNENKEAKAALTAATLEDNYQMAWKEDGTGDDLLTSLVTFQTIFEEKGTGNEGLSDLLEQRTQELKYQKIREEQQNQTVPEQHLPPRRLDCLTLSYRNGSKHNPLTLYHTMKMHGEYERMGAYEIAFKHCINSDSGLKSWLKKPRVAPSREGSKLIQSVKRPTTVKRSLLHPLGGSRNKYEDGSSGGFLIWSASSDNLHSNNNSSKKSIDVISSPMISLAPGEGDIVPVVEISDVDTEKENELTDVLSAAQALLPNQQLAQQQGQKANANRVPYEHIDTPSRPRLNHSNSSPTSMSAPTLDFKDTSSISSSESASGTSSKPLKSRTGRLFSSLGRKTSMRSYNSGKASSIRSLDKIDSGNEDAHEKVLDDLCRILPHIERSRLESFAYEANDDYMRALQLCKAAVISGKLS